MWHYPHFIIPMPRTLQIHCRFARYLALGAVLAIVLFLGTIPLRISSARMRSPTPTAVLTLGGEIERERQAARLAAQHRHLEVWISSGKAPSESRDIFRNAEVELDRLHINTQAVDTVTNFTTTVDQFQRNGIEHLYLVTSDFHMKRARAIAFFVLGSRGIAYTSIATQSTQTSTESTLRVVRDIVRSIFWIATGRTGSSIGIYLKP